MSKVIAVWIYNEASKHAGRIRHEPNDQGEYADCGEWTGTQKGLWATAEQMFRESSAADDESAECVYGRRTARSLLEAAGYE